MKFDRRENQNLDGSVGTIDNREQMMNVIFGGVLRKGIDPDVLFSPKLTSLLALIALVVGNVAGWVHVGHHCQSDHRRVAAKSVERQICACHHHCDSSVDRDRGEEPSPGEEHDSGTCSVCQNFFASRDMVATIEPVAFWLQLAPVAFEPPISDPAPSSILLPSSPTRGPPLV